ncbi:hypothetical protein [Streptomyces sp. NPDC048636]|uniref:hypothetical protein n=1 Tax=Streptomyces sp. NPDC048636 TaxID=3155762 RepID=UPI0034470557
MDYCASCRRTLNGVVTCPECGAYDPLAGPADPKALSTRAIAQQVFGPERREDTAEAVAPLTAQLGAVTLTQPSPVRRSKRRRRAVAVAALAVVGGLAAGSLLLTQRSEGPSHTVSERDGKTPGEPEADTSESTPGTAVSPASRAPDRASRQGRPTFTAPPPTTTPPRPSPGASEPAAEESGAPPSATRTRKPPKETPTRRPSHTPRPPKPSSSGRPGPIPSGTATPSPSGSGSPSSPVPSR